MKALILLLLITACSSIEERVNQAIETTPDLSCLYLPLVINGSIQPSGCERIKNNVLLYYVLEDRVEEYQVVDCLGVEENWVQTIARNQIVEIGDLGRQHLAVAVDGMFDEWLQVLVWQGSEDPYVLNLTK